MKSWSSQNLTKSFGMGEPDVRGNGVLPLSKAGTDQSVEVVELAGGRELASRLAEMGILPGSTIKVFTNIGGPVIIEAKGSRLCLGRAMAKKIMVKIL